MIHHLPKFLITTLIILFFSANVAFSLVQNSDGISIQGIITGPDGKRLSNVTVTLWSTPWSSPDIGEMVDSVVTGDDGIYSVSYVPTSAQPERERKAPSKLELGPAWPNPTGRESQSISGQTNIPVRVETGSTYEIEVYSIDGRLIRRSQNHLSKGVHTLNIGLPETTGIYLVRVRGDQVNEVQTVTSFGGSGEVSIDVSSGNQVPFGRESDDVSASMTADTGDYTLRVDGGVYYDDYQAGFSESGVYQHNITLDSPFDPEEPWLADARERIEEHRMADFEINVKDSDGNPIPDAEVDVQMTRHEFNFGSLMGSARFEDRPSPEDARLHRELLEDKFNTVVLGAHLTDTFDEMLDWMGERDIRTRGHYLMWARYQPGEGRRGQLQEEPEDKEEIREYALDYIEEMLNFAGDRVQEWDLVNHIVTDVGGHTGYDHLFGEDFFAEVFEFAREIAPPETEMWVNEGFILRGSGGRADLYYEQIERLINYGQPPDGIGFMAHYRGDDIATMPEIYERLDRFAELVPNLQLTEFDINYDDRQFQAQYMHDVMNIVYSHPDVSGIVQWQIWGGSGDNQHLFDVDWTIRPHGEVYFDLVFNQWWTDEQGPTDSEGTFNTRGFLGDYEITVQVGDETKTVETSLGSDGTILDINF